MPNILGLPDLTKLLPEDADITDSVPLSSGGLKAPNGQLQFSDLFKHTDLPTAPVQGYSLEKTKIPGLTPKTVQRLGLNQFIVVANSPFHSMSEVYKDNRLRGKPSFVTADSIIHPYFAFTDSVAAQVIKKHVVDDLYALLDSMHACAMEQYKEAAAGDLKNDIVKNCAYILVAMRLMHPETKVTSVEPANALADAEWKNIQAGKIARSPVFERNFDYTWFQPLGWYASDAQLANYFRCHEWLSRHYFALSEVSKVADKAGDSEFRRSVLLFRCLQLAKVRDASGMYIWLQLTKLLDTVGTFNSRDHLLLPTEYAPVFRQDQTLSLANLSEPFYRTRLLLAVRKQKPIEIGAASILSPTEQRMSTDTAQVVFRLFPPTDDPGLAFAKNEAHSETLESGDSPNTPIGLLELDLHGCPEAANLLSDMLWHINPKLVKTLPPARKFVKDSASPQAYSMGTGRWQILSYYFKPGPDHSQAALRSTTWLNRQLDSACAAWVDGQISLSGLSPPVTNNASQNSGVAEANGKPKAIAEAAHAPATFHYLETTADLYRKISSDAEALAAALKSQGCLTNDVQSRLQEYSSVALHFAGIADRELEYQSISVVDMMVMANIDQVLDQLSAPLPGTLNLNNGAGAGGGCTLGLGDVGYLHVLCQTNHGMMLCRGPVYTYYELPGPAIPPGAWQKKLDSSAVHPPEWTSEFCVVQDR